VLNVPEGHVDLAHRVEQHGPVASVRADTRRLPDVLFEEALQERLNQAGVVGTAEGLQQFDTDGVAEEEIQAAADRLSLREIASRSFLSSSCPLWTRRGDLRGCRSHQIDPGEHVGALPHRGRVG
jgi:hypothetical protein